MVCFPWYHSARPLLGLYHFAVRPGAHILLHCAPSLSVARLSEVTGETGRISAVSSMHNMTYIESDELAHRYPNVQFVNSVPPLSENILRSLRGMLASLLGFSRSSTDSFAANPTVERVFSQIRSFLDPYSWISQVSCAVCYHPPHIRPVTLATLAPYEQHVISTLGELCSSFSGTQCNSLFITLIIRLDPVWATDNEDDIDILCERIFDLLGTCCAGRGIMKPKEQLMLNPTFQGDCVILVVRYRKSK